MAWNECGDEMQLLPNTRTGTQQKNPHPIFPRPRSASQFPYHLLTPGRKVINKGSQSREPTLAGVHGSFRGGENLAENPTGMKQRKLWKWWSHKYAVYFLLTDNSRKSECEIGRMWKYTKGILTDFPTNLVGKLGKMETCNKGYSYRLS